MPIYEYSCEGCGEVWEEMRKMSESSDKGVCPECHAKGNLVFSIHSSKPFRCRVISHIAPQPVYVESQQQLDKVCKENNSYIVDDNRSKQRKYWNSRKKDLKRSEARRLSRKDSVLR